MKGIHCIGILVDLIGFSSTQHGRKAKLKAVTSNGFPRALE